ncbi:MAG: translation initiation factor 2 [Xanthobacteraceae bacterium]
MRVLGVAALCVVLGGCASATRGWHEQITLTSTPSGAEATIDGLMGLSAEQPTRSVTCTTPCSVQVNRNDNLTVAFKKDGFEPQIVSLTKEVAGTGAAGFAGNILLGGLVGMAVDGASGAALDHKPNPVIVTMQPIAPLPAPPRIHTRRSRPVS